MPPPDESSAVPCGAPTVSVAMATYNGERYLVEQLDSIVRQSLPPAEIVISDDGSTDRTLAVVEDYARRCPIPIRLLPSVGRLGFADNFLRAAGACASRFIAFCDQDDVWEANKLEHCRDVLVRDGSMLALHRHTITDAALEPRGILAQGIAGDRLWEPLELDPHLTGWGNSMVFERSLLSLIPPAARPPQPEQPGKPLSHDHWIYTLAAATGRVSHIAACLCRYRQHGGNIFGLERPPLRSRLAAFLSVHVARFEARRDFAARMAALFEAAAAEHPHNPALPRAARIYALRATIQDSRIRAYTDRSLAGRIRSLGRLARLRRRDRAAAASAMSVAKDALLGVLAMGRAGDRPGAGLA